MYQLVGLPAAITTALLGFSASWLLRSGHGDIRLEIGGGPRQWVVAGLVLS